MTNKQYFTIEELTRTKSKYDNTPTPEIKVQLSTLISNVLNPLREMYGKPIKVNSGYRSPSVNQDVGGAKTSQHLKGQAADITGGNKAENKILFNLIKDHIEFDQLINEYDYTWIHISFKAGANRKQILKIG